MSNLECIVKRGVDIVRYNFNGEPSKSLDNSDIWLVLLSTLQVRKRGGLTGEEIVEIGKLSSKCLEKDEPLSVVDLSNSVLDVGLGSRYPLLSCITFDYTKEGAREYKDGESAYFLHPLYSLTRIQSANQQNGYDRERGRSIETFKISSWGKPYAGVIVIQYKELTPSLLRRFLPFI